jgi:hypothetical protein
MRNLVPGFPKLFGVLSFLETQEGYPASATFAGRMRGELTIE